jgi:hypothetical protein
MPDESHDSIISDAAAQRLIRRAAQLDRDGVSLRDLRNAAIEAGIQADAFDAAVRESNAVDGAAPVSPDAPWWVRACLVGVPDRPMAVVYYWLFLAGIIGFPTAAFLTDRIDRPLAIALIGICTFALWSTGRAIAWLDRHGWHHIRHSSSPTAAS